jgi:hypothetical protein
MAFLILVGDDQNQIRDQLRFDAERTAICLTGAK